MNQVDQKSDQLQPRFSQFLIEPACMERETHRWRERHTDKVYLQGQRSAIRDESKCLQLIITSLFH